MTVHAIVLAGGYGSRLLPFTEATPKHLLPIGDEPVIAHQLHRLARAGVTSVVLATAYHADAFRPVLGDGAAYGLDLRYTREASPLGTGGGLRTACDHLALAADDVVVVVNGDLITEHDMRAQIAQHVERRVVRVPTAPPPVRASDDVAGPGFATLHARPVDDASPYGLLHTVGDHAISRFEEKPRSHPSGLVNAGTYVLDPEVIDEIPSDVVSSLERDVFPRLAASGRAETYVDDASFADIGTPASLLTANVAWARERGRDSVVLTSGASLCATVIDSLVMPGATLGDCRLERSIIGPRAQVGDGAQVIDCIVGDDAIIAPGTRLVGETLACGEHRS